MTQQLFILGNGFDLHHGIPSRYSDFGEYVRKENTTVFDLINDYLYVDKDFWNCFEERLAGFDSDLVIDHATNYLEPYGADDWSDSFHHNYEYVIQQVVQGLSSDLRQLFAGWLKTLAIPNNNFEPKLSCIQKNALFLSFNYTTTLQNIYGVPECNVLHIHGKSNDQSSEIILGHAWEQEEKLEKCIDENTDVRVAGGYQLIDQYFVETFKPTKALIEQHQLFFRNLRDISEVYVLGHSLAEVDATYFVEVVKNVSSLARWTVSYYDQLALIQENFSRFNVPQASVRFRQLACL
ncbi:bacteriophage abortive infection AbiH family protein [Polycladidibacter hongkongensis]|uniref:bacteriophage abortive infection AbiH family protein n=1 Tax=Polycladidibacter hongkongensis TaxID=1647556 RepID=UPI00083596FA|nr:bacteriophage abortive infection AbiH family protein [Pseudovibrio hongkongensis]